MSNISLSTAPAVKDESGLPVANPSGNTPDSARLSFDYDDDEDVPAPWKPIIKQLTRRWDADEIPASSQGKSDTNGAAVASPPVDALSLAVARTPSMTSSTPPSGLLSPGAIAVRTATPVINPCTKNPNASVAGLTGPVFPGSGKDMYLNNFINRVSTPSPVAAPTSPVPRPPMAPVSSFIVQNTRGPLGPAVVPFSGAFTLKHSSDDEMLTRMAPAPPAPVQTRPAGLPTGLPTGSAKGPLKSVASIIVMPENYAGPRSMVIGRTSSSPGARGIAAAATVPEASVGSAAIPTHIPLTTPITAAVNAAPAQPEQVAQAPVAIATVAQTYPELVASLPFVNAVHTQDKDLVALPEPNVAVHGAAEDVLVPLVPTFQHSHDHPIVGAVPLDDESSLVAVLPIAVPGASTLPDIVDISAPPVSGLDPHAHRDLPIISQVTMQIVTPGTAPPVPHAVAAQTNIVNPAEYSLATLTLTDAEAHASDAVQGRDTINLSMDSNNSMMYGATDSVSVSPPLNAMVQSIAMSHTALSPAAARAGRMRSLSMSVSMGMSLGGIDMDAEVNNMKHE